MLLAVAFGGVVQAPAGAQAQPPKSTPQKPNIVFIHTDDLSSNLVQYMSAVRPMRRDGTTFSNHIVASSLCCPSRAAMLAGRFPHNTGVLTNKNLDRGGNAAFAHSGGENRTYAAALDRAGYRTGLLGKYLNGFNIRNSPVPAGWDEWHVGGKTAYSNVAGSYEITDVRHKGDTRKVRKPKQYLSDLLGKRSRDFVDRARKRNQPFFLQFSSYAPHARIGGDANEPMFPPAARDRPGGEFPDGDCGVKNGVRTKCGSLKVRRGTGFSEATYRKLDRELRDRVRMIQSVNDQIIKLRNHLTRAERANTYFVFSSDNGFHLGNHGLLRGKRSAYDHDVRTPLIVTGPGVKAGAVRSELVQSIDMYATFRMMAGLKPVRRDGHSLLALMRGKTPKDWREVALAEHTAVDPTVPGLDPDDDRRDAVTAGPRINPGGYTYRAIRTERWLYVKYADLPRHELYNLQSDPAQDRNVYASYRGLVKKTLQPKLRQLYQCGRPGKVSCWRASQIGPEDAKRLEGAKPSPNAVVAGSRDESQRIGGSKKEQASGGMPVTPVGLTAIGGGGLVLALAGASAVLVMRRRRLAMPGSRTEPDRTTTDS